MVANIGFGTLLITLIVALYGIAAAVNGQRSQHEQWINSARQSMALMFPLLTVPVLSLLYLLVTHHYQVAYVSEVTSRSMPFYLKLTALWGGQSGSLVFWSWLLAAFATAIALRDWGRDREFLPWVIIVILVTLSFFLIVNVFFENPFSRYWQTSTGIVRAFARPEGAVPFVPRDGQGLNPLLRHPGMIIHPPMLYLGFVSFIIPYAFAIAALVTGRTDDRWICLTRRWTLWAWLFLSLGLILGARWAYDVLGWGGYWGWDPVEISAFMPWLTGTAFLHSVMIQEKKDMFKRWNLVLIILTFDLVVFGTFLTRSGVLSSVHAFAQSAIGPLFFVFIALTLTVSLGLLLSRWKDLESNNELHSLFSREALFLLNNLLFLGIFVTTLWGILFPLISEIVTGQKVTVGPPFYERATGPLFAGLLLLMGIAPLTAWTYSSLKKWGRAVWKPLVFSLLTFPVLYIAGITRWQGVLGFWLVGFVFAVTAYEFWRGAAARIKAHGENVFTAFYSLAKKNRRRYGGYIVHIGVIFMALGVIGIEMYQVETQGTIPEGGSLSLSEYSITYKDLVSFDTHDGRNVTRAVVGVSSGGEELAEIYPRRDYFYDANQPMTIPGVKSTLAGDLYVILVDWREISEQGATFKIYYNPLVNWLWIGGWVFIAGILVAAWPENELDRVHKVSSPLQKRKR
ncbi:MAG: heme lyase CcmF/NrfE family subunit [Anaerolineales bacterium]